MVHQIALREKKGLGVGLQEGFIVASVDGVVGRLREAHVGVGESFDETEQHGHAVEGCGEGDEGRDDERCVGSALNLESCEKCHNNNELFRWVNPSTFPGAPHAGLRFSGWSVGKELADTEAAGIVEVEKRK